MTLFLYLKKNVVEHLTIYELQIYKTCGQSIMMTLYS